MWYFACKHFRIHSFDTQNLVVTVDVSVSRFVQGHARGSWNFIRVDISSCSSGLLQIFCWCAPETLYINIFLLLQNLATNIQPNSLRYNSKFPLIAMKFCRISIFCLKNSEVFVWQCLCNKIHICNNYIK